MGRRRRGDARPTMAVDDNVASFSDINSIGQTVTQTDPTAGNVYVAWTSNDTPYRQPAEHRSMRTGSGSPPRPTAGTTSARSRSSTATATIGPAKLTNPSLTISQGRAARAAGTLGPTDPGVTAIPGGQVLVGYDDFNSGATATPPFDILDVNQVSGAVVKSFLGNGGTIGDAAKVPAGNTVHTPNITEFLGHRQCHRSELRQRQRPRRHAQPDPPDPERARARS